MKTVSGNVVSTKPVSLSNAAKMLSNFISIENGASEVVSTYLRRASKSFNELVQFHKLNKLKKHNVVDTEGEDPIKSDRIPQESKEHRVGDSGSNHKNHKYKQNQRSDQQSIEAQREKDDNRNDSLRKRDKKKKREGSDSKIGGSFGIEQKDTEVEADGEVKVEPSMRKKEKRNEKSRGREKEGRDDLGIEEERRMEKGKKKKKRKTAELDGVESSNLAEHSGSRTKKKRRTEGD